MTKDNPSLSLDFSGGDTFAPLAARMRPKTLDDYVGQQHILGQGKPLRIAIEQGHCHSLIFWGPPGTGKTTLAELIARYCDADIERVSAVTSGIKDIRAAIENAKQRKMSNGRRTLLFVDEVHRFNKSQQDAFLPHIEDGTIVFIGATTENPAFELNQAILSRARVYLLKKLESSELAQVLDNTLTDHHKGLAKQNIDFQGDSKAMLLTLASGDARRLLNLLENCLDICKRLDDGGAVIDAQTIKQIAGERQVMYDKGGDAFYDLISAFHKSVRGSAPDAALYWYCRILEGGGDPLYVARRLLAIASEDIGNADPRAMQLAINAWDTFQRVGPAEGERAIAQATVYMALAPKSNAVYTAFKTARQIAKETGHLDVPVHLKNATSAITKELGHGREYRYAHDEAGGYAAGENYFPEAIFDSQFYFPTERGLEKQLTDKLDYLRQLDSNSLMQRYSNEKKADDDGQ
jgi:putative ATPase